jgi:hypothetical protein
MATFQELRSMALEARKESATERQSKYFRARDDAFAVITDGVMDKIHTAAKEGRFKYPVYRWTNQSRSKDGVKEEAPPADDNAQLYFGNDESGKNGLHIMALLQPTGLKYEDTLLAKLREFFNSQTQQGEEGDGPRQNHLRVFLQRRPTNPNMCAIFVSWEKILPNRATVRPASGFVRRPFDKSERKPAVERTVEATGAEAGVQSAAEGFKVVVRRGEKKTRGGAPVSARR